MKKKKQKNRIWIIAVVIILIAGGVLMLLGDSDVDYDKANKKTKNLGSYAMTINTIVTIEDGEEIKQSTIDQVVDVCDRDKKNMIYNVSTTATSVDVTTGDVAAEENSYMFYNNAYYYSYPGVKYTSPVEHDRALTNIDNLTNVISFDYSDMINPENEKTDDSVIFYYTVNYEATSDYVKSLLQNAVNKFEGVNFSPGDISAAATVHKKGHVTNRELCIEYKGDGGQRITVEIYTELTDTKPEIEAPNSDEYLSMVQ